MSAKHRADGNPFESERVARRIREIGRLAAVARNYLVTGPYVGLPILRRRPTRSRLRKRRVTSLPVTFCAALLDGENSPR